MTLPSEGPRERLGRVGADRLSDAELLAVLLGTGARGTAVPVLAAQLLTEAGGLPGLERMGAGELARRRGLGPSKASRVVAAIELGRRVVSCPLPRGVRLTSSRAVWEAVRGRLGRAEVEHFVAIPLDAKNRPIGEIHVATGSLAACPVAPADVFRALLREAAAAVVLVHNHPSGEPSPSPEDVALTDRLSEAGELLGVRVVDHVIVGRDSYFSFLDAGLLDRRGRP